MDVGSTVPSFSLLDHDGVPVTDRALAGRPYVLYFYPKDDTPGCTREACDFRDGLQAFRALGVDVIGVSPDSPARHARFRARHGLPFRLLSDPERNLARAFGAFGRKVFLGRETEGILRSTFLVDRRGVVARAWRRVRVEGHVAEVEAAARALR